jgi:16S rRNA (guanine527-N7)-methyltransferase
VTVVDGAGVAEEGSWRPRLYGVLGRSLEAGFLGSPTIGDHIDHACGFAAAVLSERRAVPETLVDLGSGGGVPALVLAELWPATKVAMVEANERRSRFLEAEVLDSDRGRVTVLPYRAEVVGRDARYRQAFEVVTSRSFGSPGVTAECAAPLLAVGGLLVVSDPPGVPVEQRWPLAPLDLLGLALLHRFRYQDRYNYACLEKTSDCPSRYPRRVGIPAKRPLF